MLGPTVDGDDIMRGYGQMRGNIAADGAGADNGDAFPHGCSSSSPWIVTPREHPGAVSAKHCRIASDVDRASRNSTGSGCGVERGFATLSGATTSTASR